MRKIKKVAILTGGGDCAGINTFIAAAVMHGSSRYRMKFTGIKQAFKGAASPGIERYCVSLTPAFVKQIEKEPSTVLLSSRFNPFSPENRKAGFPERILRNLEKLKVDGLIVSGGNDTIRTALGFHKITFPVVAVPKSIDNDVSGTDVMLGFRTAVEFAVKAFVSTCVSARTHGRVSIVEIMGRDAGWLAYEAGRLGDADIILVPEKTFYLERLCEHVRKRYKAKPYVNIMVAEGVTLRDNDPVLRRAIHADPVLAARYSEKTELDQFGNRRLGGVSEFIQRILKRETGISSIRLTSLGFSLRGLPPNKEDMALGINFGRKAVELLAQGKSGYVVVKLGQKTGAVPMEQAIVLKKLTELSDPRLRAANVFW